MPNENEIAKGRYIRNGQLTEYGRHMIRLHANKGLSTEQIQKKVPAAVPVTSIRAFRAIANRNKTQ